jgi:ABC-type multidrug transport system ATPase subunit
MTSHLMDEVEYLCDRIGIISQGQLRCVGDINHLK